MRFAGGSLAALLLMAASGCVHQPVSHPAMAMWRMDCGTFDIDNLEGQGRVIMPTSCYLIRHDDDYLMFDAGMEASLYGKPVRDEAQTLRLDHTLAEQFATLGVDPAKVGTLIVSHYHGDHHSQAGQFPNARLVIGAADAAALRKESDKGALAPWLDGKRPVTEVSADRDLTGDGRLTVLFTPGHTPGHLSLLVRLTDASYILSGDLVHQHRQLEHAEPSGNHVDKVRGKTEIERVKALANGIGARIIVGHDAGNIDLLPAFPKAAE